MIIAVDGPAASGKGTLAQGLARHYGLPHLDTGLLYRAVGLAVRDVVETGNARGRLLDYREVLETIRAFLFRSRLRFRSVLHQPRHTERASCQRATLGQAAAPMQKCWRFGRLSSVTMMRRRLASGRFAPLFCLTVAHLLEAPRSSASENPRAHPRVLPPARGCLRTSGVSWGPSHRCTG